MQNAELRMKKATLIRRLSAFCLLHSAFACAAASPPPQWHPSTALPPPPAEESVIEIPIQASLAPLAAEVERQVPKKMEKLDGYEMDPQNRFGLKYKVERDPVNVFMQNYGLHAVTTVRFALEGCVRSTRMWPCVSCGFSEPLREARIVIDSRLEWDAQWRIRSITKPRPVEFPRPCTITLLNIDLSAWKIGPLVDQQLREVAKTIDRDAPKLTGIRPVAQEVWTSLQTPAELAPRTWLVFEPVDVALAPLRGSGQTITSTLTLRARTRVVVGDKPAVTPRPLPALRVAQPAGGGIRVPLDIELPYAEAGRLLTEQFGKQTYRIEGHDLIVDTIQIGPAANGKMSVAVNLDYRGGTLRNYRGLVRLEGTPAFDPATSTVSLPDLDYALEKRRNPFLRTVERAVHDTLRARLRENARWPVAAELASVRTQIEKAMSQTLARGVTMRGSVQSLQPLRAVPHAAGITVRVMATGTAVVEVK